MTTIESGISFVIPAKNEEENIAVTLDAIKTYCDIPFEVIVVDHNSSDNTAAVAVAHNAKVVKKVGGSIGEARNEGVLHKSHASIVFIDADVSITQDWQNNIRETLALLRANPLFITGSRCTPDNNGSEIEKRWFANLPRTENLSHIGTGHMIVSDQLFTALGGFTKGLTTGEDYDLCKRAETLGGQVRNSPKLRVIHRHYPKNVTEFFRRERWHGKSDFQSLTTIKKSKVAIATLIFIALHLTLIIGGLNHSVLISLISLLGIAGLLGKSTLALFSQCTIQDKIFNFGLFYVYYWGRGASCFDSIKRQLLSIDAESRWR